jgi:hypothetical protein
MVLSMRRPKNLSKSVANVIFSPTLLAYGWISLKYVIAGLILYFVSMIFAYKMWLFENVKSWPKVSLAALYCGPPLLGLGVYFSTQPFGYSMLIPLGIYLVLSIFGGFALVGKFNTTDSTVGS